MGEAPEGDVMLRGNTSGGECPHRHPVAGDPEVTPDRGRAAETADQVTDCGVGDTARALSDTHGVTFYYG
jgi:hypothetical protein